MSSPDLERAAAIRERLSELNPQAILFDGCDAALVAIGCQHSKPVLAVYDYDLLVEVYGGDTDAVEWVEFNIVCAWYGEHTPVILHYSSLA